jgi:N-acetylmuramoyl-L-alanine amidase
MSVENIFVIDAGHGPNTSGKRSPDGSLREFNFNHPTAQALVTILNLYENVKTYTVYDTNRDTPLEERTDRANAIRSRYANLINAGKVNIYFISIHANAFGTGGWNTARGIETYVMTPKSNNPGSMKLAEAVHPHLIKAAGLYNRGIKSANFHVLRETYRIPAILVECGFMTNRNEATLLKSRAYQQKCAQGIVNGLIALTGIKRKPVAAPKSGGLYKVQAGAFSTKDAAEKHASAIEKAGFKTFISYEK